MRFEQDVSLRGILFDLDGTIVDSEPYWAIAQTKLVTSFGGRWADSDVSALVGKAPTTITGALQTAGVDLHSEDIVDRLVGHVAHQLHEQLEWMPGADTLLYEARAAGVKTALVTMSPRPIVDVVLGRLPSGSFDAVVCLDDVEMTKPHPQAYLQALALLELRPEEAIALEDSVPGVTAALAAGIATIAISHRVQVTKLGVSVWSSLAGMSLQNVRDEHTRFLGQRMGAPEAT